jgi:HEAT repeat protein
MRIPRPVKLFILVWLVGVSIAAIDVICVYRIKLGVVETGIASLKQKDPVVRRKGADMLGSLGQFAARAVPDLTEALADADEEVRRAAADALNRIDPEAATKAGVDR